MIIYLVMFSVTVGSDPVHVIGSRVMHDDDDDDDDICICIPLHVTNTKTR